MSISQVLLEQRIKQQERAMKAEERSQANIIKKMTLPSDIMHESDHKILKGHIVRQIQKMDEMLTEYDSIQNIINNQSEQMNKLERQESAGKDATIAQLQKELEARQREYRESTMRQMQQLGEVDRYRAEKITSKLQVGNRVLEEARAQKDLLAGQQKILNQMDMQTLFQIYKSERFGGSEENLDNKVQEQEQKLEQVNNELIDLIRNDTEADKQQIAKIRDMQRDKALLEEKLKDTTADVDFINKFIAVVEAEKERQKRYGAKAEGEPK